MAERLELLLSDAEREVGERRRAEIQLCRSQEILAEKNCELLRLTAVMESTSDLVAMVDPTLHLLYMNPAGRRLLGLVGENPVGRRLYSPQPRWAMKVLRDEALPAVLRDGVWVGETAILQRTPEGEREVPVSQLLVAHKAPRGELEYFSTVVRDITETKESERAHRDLNAQLAAQLDELESFAYTVSHDIKAPLFTITGFLGYLEEDIAASASDQIREDIAVIRAAAEQMHQLLEGILEFSRVGRMDNRPREIDLGELVAEALERLQGRITGRGVTVEVADSLGKVHGDYQRLATVWQNLIDNAVKYMGERADPHVEVGVRTQTAGGAASERVFFVRDNGIGVEPELGEKIFGLFHQLDREVEGTGIGLALARRIVEHHDGRIWVESEGLGRGSTFCLTLGGDKAKRR
jgi:PAS domain S-box-containing protein